MRKINRDILLNRLINRRENGDIKVITGPRRSGKSYLLFNLYYDYLLKSGVEENRIIRIAFDDDLLDESLLNYKNLGAYIRNLATEDGLYYVFLDEIQFVENFEKVLNGLNKMENLDIYVTGSNSRFLSSDILTEFRGRGDEVRVQPLSFKEFMSVYDGTPEKGFLDYCTYGGLPRITFCKTDEEKSIYLKNLYKKTYIKDVEERHGLRTDSVLETLVSIISSSVGSLTNPTRLANTFLSVSKKSVSDKTLRTYIGYLKEAFLISEAERYDVRGKKYIGSNSKFYFCDVGIRNAVVNFRQIERTHIMENVIYNELLFRGFNVDVGVVEFYEQDEASQKSKRQNVEIDFVCNKASQRIYVQSAFALETREKTKAELRPFLHTNDSFKKIIVVGEDTKPHFTEEGVQVVSVYDFLLDENIV